MTRDEKQRVKAVQPKINGLWAQYEQHERMKTALYAQIVELQLSTTPFENEFDCPFYNGAHDVCEIRSRTGESLRCRCQ